MNLNGTIKKTQALSGRLVKSSGGGGSVQEIYWVRYGVGTATNAEVNEAVAANKLPICYWDSTDAYGRPRRTLYFLIRNTPTESFFSGVDYINNTIIVRRLYADAWDTQTIRYEGKLTWDTTPRFGSANPVTSGGIYNAIQNATVSDERIAEAVDDWLSVQAPSIGTMSYAAKQALLACFRHVAWIDDQGQSYYNALESELFPDATLESITAVFTQGSAVIYDTDSLDTLEQYLTVTATYADSTTAIVTDYTLSGTLAVGTSTITVSYGGKTTTFTVTVTVNPLDQIAYGTLTYRDIFITNNKVLIGDFEGTYVIDENFHEIPNTNYLYKFNYWSGSAPNTPPSISTEYSVSPTHSLKCFDTKPTRAFYKELNAPSYASGTHFLIAANIKCTRYVAGNIGAIFNSPINNAVDKASALQNEVSNGFVPKTAIAVLTSARTEWCCYIGVNGTGGNADCFIDNVVISAVPAEMTAEQAQTLYENYTAMVLGGAV